MPRDRTVAERLRPAVSPGRARACTVTLDRPVPGPPDRERRGPPAPADGHVGAQPGRSGRADVARLQRDAGNRAVARWAQHGAAGPVVARTPAGTSGGTARPAPRSTVAGAVPTVQRVPERAGVVAARYDFSTRCGWIDWSHAGPELSRTLIDRVRAASAAAGAAPAGGAAAPDAGALSTPAMQSSAVGIVLSSATVEVRLRRALSAEEVLQVALSMYKRLSLDFEVQQAWTDSIGDSSFSQEDLPSNLLGFYAAARGFSRADLARICGVVDRAASLAEFDQRHEFAKNRTFTPVGATEPWPAELSTIDSAAGAALYEITAVSVARGAFAHRFAPLYRVVGRVGEVDLLVLSLGGTEVTAAQDLQVVPTYQWHDTTTSRGHLAMVEVQPSRAQDATLMRRLGLSVPAFLPEPVLVPLSAPGTP